MTNATRKKLMIPHYPSFYKGGHSKIDTLLHISFYVNVQRKDQPFGLLQCISNPYKMFRPISSLFTPNLQ